jgi:hypothetical protein
MELEKAHEIVMVKVLVFQPKNKRGKKRNMLFLQNIRFILGFVLKNTIPKGIIKIKI